MVLLRIFALIAFVFFSSFSACAASKNLSHGVSLVSWYGGRLIPCRLNSGKILPPGFPGVSHRHLPKGTLIRFSIGKKSIVAVVNDRGAMLQPIDFDISKPIADRLGITKRGRAMVAWTVIGAIK